jgi:hypothetical protein
MLKKWAIAVAGTLVACQPNAQQNATEHASVEGAGNAEDAQKNVAPADKNLIEPQYANYPESAAYLLHGGNVDRSISSETLQGQGPNQSLRFFVDYRAAALWSAEEYRKAGRRYCRWHYNSNGIERILYVIRSANKKDEVANGRRTQAGPIPGPDDTADNCNSVQNNVIVPKINEITSVVAWQSFLDDDKAKVDELIKHPVGS